MRLCERGLDLRLQDVAIKAQVDVIVIFLVVAKLGDE
jgi:hypothetical protein